MKKIIPFIAKTLGLVLYFVSHLFPRNKKRWVFGEPHGFNNNSKYLYIDIVESHPEIDAIWIGDKATVAMLQAKGLKAYTRTSIKGVFCCMTAKVYVVSWTTGDINFYLSGGAVVLNLWHGTPLKKCLWLENDNALPDSANFISHAIHCICAPVIHFGNIFVNSPSHFYTKIYMDMFRVKREQVIEDIYPRDAFMMKKKDDIISFLETYGYHEDLTLIKNLLNYNKTILYAPTFRDNGKDFIASSGIDFVSLNTRLTENNYLLIIKLHPATTYDGAKFGKLKNILFLSNKYDLYPLMPFTDMLISDYSSIMFDYLLLKKKVVAFTFDYEEYIKSCRDLLFDLKEGLQSIPMVNSTDELIDFVFSNIEGESKVDSDQSYDRYWKPSDNLIERLFAISQ